MARTGALPAPLLVIGGGKMGSALIEGWRKAGLRPSSIHVVEHNLAQRAALEARGYKVYAHLPEGLAPQATLLAIKPQGFADMAQALGAWYSARPAHVFISILAGIPLQRLQDALGPKTPVIRAMPNTPALIGEGVTGYVAGGAAKTVHTKRAEALLQVVGDVVRLSDEAGMDAVTAVSGSGPAYVFHFLEAMVVAAMEQGIPEEVAQAMVLQTAKGAVLLAESQGLPLDTLRRNVTSPGGTTEAALAVLMKENSGFIALLDKAVKAAARRSKQLSAS